jgi:ankyrin repeat protein
VSAQAQAVVRGDEKWPRIAGRFEMKELFEAVRAGDLPRVQALVDANPSLAIFAAAILGQADRIKELLAANRALVSAVSEDGWTPLHLAAFFGKEDAARALLNGGADVKARSTNTMENTALHAAVAGKHAALVKLLIDRGASANARQNGGFTPMHSAANNGDVETARVLIDAGADVSARADNQQRPIDLAMTQAKGEMVELLEASGATL